MLWLRMTVQPLQAICELSISPSRDPSQVSQLIVWLIEIFLYAVCSAESAPSNSYISTVIDLIDYYKARKKDHAMGSGCKLNKPVISLISK